MADSKVFYCDMSTGMKEPLTDKLIRLAKTAGIDKIDFEGKFVAIKIHFGERGNLAFLRHNYAAALVKYVKAKGGKPFLTDCSTLYTGVRSDAISHLECASDNGYNMLSVGCPIIIADGLLGTTETLVPINCEQVKEAKIGTAIMDADIIISLSHFKAHEGAGVGGAIKNLGMGCGSKAGKKEMHEEGKPKVSSDECVGCGTCEGVCGQTAISYLDSKAAIDYEKCAGCGRCWEACPAKAIVPPENTNEILNKRISEYALAVIKDRPHFHLCLAVDISPLCDCYGVNEVPIIPDVGMYASFDPVALDHAAADMCNAQPINADSELARCNHEGGDHFHALAPETNWEAGLRYAEKIGVGSFGYELVTVK